MPPNCVSFLHYIFPPGYIVVKYDKVVKYDVDLSLITLYWPLED